MRMSDWSSDVCSSDLGHQGGFFRPSLRRAHDRRATACESCKPYNAAWPGGRGWTSTWAYTLSILKLAPRIRKTDPAGAAADRPRLRKMAALSMLDRKSTRLTSSH